MKEPTPPWLDGEEDVRDTFLEQLIRDNRDWLLRAREATDVVNFSNTRAYMTEIVAYIKKRGFNQDLLLDAMEVLRLSERAVGKAVRRDQAAGKLGSLGSNNPARGGKKLPSTLPYVGYGTTANAIYKMTDGVTDEQFAMALKEAREEGRLSRDAVVRRVTNTGKKAPRKDLVDQAREVAEELRRVTVRLQKLNRDDRMERNKAEVAARMRPYLDAAVDVLTQLKETLEER